jgi:ABC-type multidrug transport system fused ATPase/permease subunit
MMLFLSYAAASAAMLAAALYLLLRLHLFVSTATMLVASLLLIYGPAALSFTLSGGQYAFLIRPLLGNADIPSSMFPMMSAKAGDLGPVIVAINFSLALMYVGIIAGIEGVNRLWPARAAATDAALTNWNTQKLADEPAVHRLLIGILVVLALVMLWVSIKENHIGTIRHFFSMTNNYERNALRAHGGGSPSYFYRVVLTAIAPMFLIWGLLAGLKVRSAPLLLAAGLLFVATMIGKIETLSKAPPAFLLIQIIMAVFLVYANRISWRTTIGALVVVALLFYIVTRLVIVFPPTMPPIEAVYSRVFEVENETLVENFAVFPKLHPFMWGGNIRPLALLLGKPYEPSFSLVAYIWYGDHDITSPTLFIADAWADFAYAGVFLYSVIAGMLCRGIDLIFLARGKSVVAIAVLSASLMGLLSLLTTALNIAVFSGGLLLAPVLAAILMLAAPLTAARPLASKLTR